MDVEIKPYIGAEKLLLGNHLQTTLIEVSLYEYTKSVQTRKNSIFYKYYFEELDLVVGVDQNEEIEYLEFFNESLIEVNILYEGLNILQYPYQKLIKVFQQLDSNLIIDYDMFVSLKLGIGVADPDQDDNLNALPPSIIVFRENHYASIQLPQKAKSFD